MKANECAERDVTGLDAHARQDGRLDAREPALVSAPEQKRKDKVNLKKTEGSKGTQNKGLTTN